MLLKNHTVKISLCGMLTALATVLMFLTGLIPIATYALPAAAGLLMIVAVVECGPSWAWPVFAASSVLSLFLAADKEAVAMYILFFGYYPIAKALIERRRMSKIVTALCKLAVFNVAMTADFLVTIYLLGVPKDSFTLFGVYLPAAFLAVGNVVFLVYDYAATGLVLLYWQQVHPHIKKWFGLK